MIIHVNPKFDCGKILFLREFYLATDRSSLIGARISRVRFAYHLREMRACHARNKCVMRNGAHRRRNPARIPRVHVSCIFYANFVHLRSRWRSKRVTFVKQTRDVVSAHLTCCAHLFTHERCAHQRMLLLATSHGIKLQKALLVCNVLSLRYKRLYIAYICTDVVKCKHA
jgi:hypothetical protein